MKNRLQTLEGFETWDIIGKAAAQLRIAPSGSVIGFDLPALMELCKAHHYNITSFAELFSSAESGLIKGLKNYGESSSQCNSTDIDPGW